jgi:hypothetical protein
MPTNAAALSLGSLFSATENDYHSQNGGWRNMRVVEAIVLQSGRLWRKNQR